MKRNYVPIGCDQQGRYTPTRFSRVAQSPVERAACVHVMHRSAKRWDLVMVAMFAAFLAMYGFGVI